MPYSPKIITTVSILILLLFFSNLVGQKTKIDSLQREINKTSNDSAKVMLMDKIVWEYIMTNPDTALILARKEYSYLQNKKVTKMLGWTLNTIASCFTFGSNQDSAIFYYSKSLEIKRKNKDEKGVATSLTNLGTCFQQKSLYNKALQCYLESYEICQKLRLNEKMLALGSNIAQLQEHLGFARESIKTCHNNLKLAKTIKSADDIADNYLLLAGCYQILKVKDSCFYYYFKSINSYKNNNDEIGMAGPETNLATYYIDLGEFENAYQHFLIADEIYKKNEIEENRHVTLEGIGHYFLSKNNFDEAIKYYEKSFEIAKKYDVKTGLSSATSHLFRVYNQKQNYKKAIEYLLLNISYNDSLNQNSDKMEYTKKMYEFELEKEQTTNKLEKEKIELKAAEENRRQNLIIISIVVVLILSFIFSMFIYAGLKKNKKATEIISKQKQEVEQKNILISAKQNEIVDSIKYAKRIQYSLLANKTLINKYLPENFILFKPKDLVSGDFYWSIEHNNRFYLAVCDSTGHGVPGAFMSLLNSNYLIESVREKNISKPNEIFNHVRKQLIENISLDGARDGMDAVLFCWDHNTNKVTYAAANNAPILIQNNSIIVLPTDKMPIGKGERNDSFSLFEIDCKKGDSLYIYTDGFADQFGGPKGKKFMYKQLNQLLLDNHVKPIHEQEKILEKALSDWKMNLEQIDDICVIGLKL